MCLGHLEHFRTTSAPAHFDVLRMYIYCIPVICILYIFIESHLFFIFFFITFILSEFECWANWQRRNKQCNAMQYNTMQCKNIRTAAITLLVYLLHRTPLIGKINTVFVADNNKGTETNCKMKHLVLLDFFFDELTTLASC